jgi:hypothetical protein
MVPARWLILLGFALLSWGLASSCQDQAYTLETPEGIAGGGAISYNGTIAVLSQGACFESPGLIIQAQQLSDNQETGLITLDQLEAITPHYRIRARTGTVQNGIFTAQGILLTTCTCGSNLRFLSQSAQFDVQTGQLILNQTQIGLYRLVFGQIEEVKVDTRTGTIPGLMQNGQIASPLVIGYNQGLSLGLANFPIPGTGADLGTFPVSLTFYGSGLGGFNPTLNLGISGVQGAASGGFSLTLAPSGISGSFQVQNGDVSMSGGGGLFSALLEHSWSWNSVTLTPFARAAEEAPSLPSESTNVQGLSLGVFLGSQLTQSIHLAQQNVQLSENPYAVLTAYNDYPTYLAYGFNLTLSDGPLSLSYALGSENRPSLFEFERHPAQSILSGSLSLGRLHLTGSYTFFSSSGPGTTVQQLFQGQASYDWTLAPGTVQTQAYLDWSQGVLSWAELRFGFQPNPLQCAGGLSLAPSLGYDLLGHRLSRWGLVANYADCCFIWSLGYEDVLVPRPYGATGAGGNFIFGLTLR